MKEVKNYLFTSEDYELLRKTIPFSPCKYCNVISCCGCEEHSEYIKKIEPYKNNNIFDFAQKIRDYYFIKKQIDQLNDELSNILKEIPNDIIDNVINENK